MMKTKYVYEILRDTAFAYIADDALTRDAAISVDTVTSLSPALLIVVAISGTSSVSKRRKVRWWSN